VVSLITTSIEITYLNVAIARRTFSCAGMFQTGLEW